MTTEKFETLLYEVERGRLRIPVNRPEKRNALSFQLLTSCTTRSGRPHPGNGPEVRDERGFLIDD
jgi:hypothetical protein